MQIRRDGDYFWMDYKYTPWMHEKIKSELSKRFFDYPKKMWKVPVSNLLELKEFAKKHHWQWALDDKPEQDFTINSLPELNIEIPLKRKLYPYQRQGVAYAIEKKRVLIGDKPGLGKALEIGSKVLTPTGWINIEDAKVGTIVCTPDGKTTRVKGFYPQGVKDVYEVTFSDGAKVRCCDEHLWSVYTRNDVNYGKANRVMSLRQIIDSGIKKSIKLPQRKYFIPVLSNVTLHSKELLIHPYLIGLLIGDGCLRLRTQLSTSDEEIVQSFKDLLPDGMQITHKSRYDYTISQAIGKNQKSKFEHYLEDYGLKVNSPDKSIPHDYLFASREDRIALLQGLMDSDGWISKDGIIIQYSTVSEKLKNDFVSLVRSLGGIAKVSSKQPKKNGEKYGLLSYNISINMPANICPFRLKRKKDLFSPNTKYFPSRSIEKIELVGRNECFCIAVNHPDKLFITDDYVVTHNTGQAIAAVTAQNAFPCLVICPNSPITENWVDEWNLWTNKKAKVITPELFRYMNRFIESDMIQVFVIHYEGLKKYFVDSIDKDDNGKFTLRNIKFSSKISLFKSVICDESHRCINFSSQRTKFVKGICKDKEIIYLLSGTAMVNKPKDLLPQLGILDQYAPFGNYKNFITRYCAGQKEASNLKELNKKLTDNCFFSRNKKDVLTDLPDKIRNIVYCDLDHASQIEYNAAAFDLESYLIQYKNADDEKVARSMRGEVMVRIGILKNISAKGKLAQVREFINSTIESEKLGLFMLQHEIVDEMLHHYPGTLCITGRESDHQRVENKNRFQTDPDAKLIFLGLKTANEGVTLTAASHMGFIELPWHAAGADQCEDRFHRIGQKDSVRCTYFLGRNTIDEWLYFDVIDAKRKMGNDVLGGNEDAVEVNIVDSFVRFMDSHNKKEVAA